MPDMKRPLQRLLRAPRLLHVLLLAIILVVGVWLRWADIGSESLWTDELYSMHWAQKSLGQILANASADVHPPTYYLLLHFWTQLFGASEAALRSLSALLGVLALPLMYALGRSIAPEPRKAVTGVVASALLAVSHFHIYYAHEARNYTMTALCAIWSMLAFVRLLEGVFFEVSSDSASVPASTSASAALFSLKHPRALHYLVATAALMHTHLFALFVVAAQSLFVASLLVFERKKFFRLATPWFVVQIVLLALFVPWGRILLHQILSVNKQGFWIEEPTMFTLAETFAEYAGGFWLLAVFAALSMIAWTRFEREHSPDEPSDKLSFALLERWSWRVRIDGAAIVWMLLLWLVVPIAIPFVKSILSAPAVYYIKYTIPALPALLLLAAKGVAAIPSRAVQSAIVCMMVALSFAEVREEWGTGAVHLNKERWREAAQILDSAVAPHDVVLTHQWYYEWALEYYQPRRFRIQAVPPQFLKLRSDIIGGLLDNALERSALLHNAALPTADTTSRVWLVLAQRDGNWSVIQDELRRRGYTQRSERVLPSFYRKFFVNDEYADNQTIISLKKTYWTPHIRLLLFEK
jgi:mannosyltransferase